MGHGLFLFYGLSLRRYTVFDCFNVVSLSPVNGGLLIKNTCPVTENTLEVRKSLRVYFLHWALNMKELQMEIISLSKLKGMLLSGRSQLLSTFHLSAIIQRTLKSLKSVCGMDISIDLVSFPTLPSLNISTFKSEKKAGTETVYVDIQRCVTLRPHICLSLVIYFL